MEKKEMPFWTMLAFAVAIGAIVDRITGNVGYGVLSGFGVFIYAGYLGITYAENGKQVMMDKLKEHAFMVVFMAVALAISIGLAVCITNWLNLPAFAGFVIWIVILGAGSILGVIPIIKKASKK
jgi:ethanolamine ammonia-lyase large subunit